LRRAQEKILLLFFDRSNSTVLAGKLIFAIAISVNAITAVVAIVQANRINI
jgi:hypothetical protein